MYLGFLLVNIQVTYNFSLKILLNICFLLFISKVFSEIGKPQVMFTLILTRYYHRRECWGTYLTVQGLKIHLPMQEVRVRSLVRQPGSYMLAAKKPKHKTEQYCNKFSKDLKNCPHQTNKQTKNIIVVPVYNPFNLTAPFLVCALVFSWWQQLSIFLHLFITRSPISRKSGKQTTSEYLTYKTSDIDKGHTENIPGRELLKGNNSVNLLI